jgi:hypothetical protein
MKHYHIIKGLGCLLLLGLALTSCEDNFDAKIYGKLSSTNFPATASDYENYMMDCYVPFSVNWSYNFSSQQHNFYVPEGGLQRCFDTTSDESAAWNIGSWGWLWTLIGEAKFDDMKFQGRASVGAPQHFEKVREVSRFTKIINELEKADPSILPDEKKKEFVGEARLCRGLMMYNLLHLFGPVPVIVDPSLLGDTINEAHLERPGIDAMTQYITDDLEYATQHVAEKQAEKGRYTADYARICLMRHYLNEGYHMQGYYKKAYDLFGQFTGNYSLYSDGSNPYADQFKIAHKFNCETIMAVSCSNTATGSGNEGNFNAFSWYMLPWDAAKYDDNGNPTPFVNQGGGWGMCFNISKQFYDTFEPGDKRAETIITSYYSSQFGWITENEIGDRWDGFIINKFPIETATSFQGTDIPLARWADALLLYAEADVRAHNAVSQKAIDCINEVRHRAGLSDLAADKASSVDSFLDALLLERGHELFYECCRKIDMIRFGKYYTLMKATGREPSSQYFPIPDYAVQQAKSSGYTLTQYYTRDNYDGPKK